MSAVGALQRFATTGFAEPQADAPNDRSGIERKRRRYLLA